MGVLRPQSANAGCAVFSTSGLHADIRLATASDTTITTDAAVAIPGRIEPKLLAALPRGGSVPIAAAADRAAYLAENQQHDADHEQDPADRGDDGRHGQ
jgi:hypothetical protein